MKPLSARVHGVIDYAIGLLLVGSPWLLGFHDVFSATMTMVLMGLIVLALAFSTDFPLGVVKALPFKTMGILETLGALFLLSSPWLLNFELVTAATILAVAVGVIWLAVIALTNYSSGYHRPVH